MAFLSPLRPDPPDRVGGVLDLLMAGLTKIIAFFLHEIVVLRRMDTVAEETLALRNRFVDVRARKLAFSMAGETKIRHVPDEELPEVTLVRIVTGGAHPCLERAMLSRAGHLPRCMAGKAKVGRVLQEDTPGLRSVGAVARGAEPLPDRPVLDRLPREIALVVTHEAEIGCIL